MKLDDDPIPEYVRDAGEVDPATIGRNVDVQRKYIGQRCRALADYGLLEKRGGATTDSPPMARRIWTRNSTPANWSRATRSDRPGLSESTVPESRFGVYHAGVTEPAGPELRTSYSAGRS